MKKKSFLTLLKVPKASSSLGENNAVDSISEITSGWRFLKDSVARPENLLLYNKVFHRWLISAKVK